MTYQQRSLFGLMPWRQIPMTAMLVGGFALVSIVATGFQRRLGFGISNLEFRTADVLNGEIWRLITYPFVESNYLGLIFSALMLWIFGGWFEQAYGRRDWLRFFFFSAVGAALISIPFRLLINILLPFADIDQVQGPGPVLDATLMAFVMLNPNSNILFGFVLPMQTKTVIWIVIALDVVRGLMEGISNLGMTLGGLAMGYILVSGIWRPHRLKLLLQSILVRNRRRGLFIVPPKKPSKWNN